MSDCVFVPSDAVFRQEYARCRLRAYQALKQELLRTDSRCPPMAAPASTVIEGAAVPSERRPVHAQ